MSKGKLPNLMLFVKLGSSPPSLAVLEHINANIHVFKRFCRIRVTSFTDGELQNPRILKQLEEYNISGLPALLTNKGDMVFGAESIIKFIHPINFKTEKEEKQIKQRQARRYDDDDLLNEWNTRMMDINDQEEHEKDLKKDITSKQSQDLRDDKLTQLVDRARKNAPDVKGGPMTSVEKINKARFGNQEGKQRGGPTRSRDTAPISELNESVSNFNNQSQQRLRQKIEDDDDIHGIKPPGRSNGASIRNKALNGASKDRAQQRLDNIEIFMDDEDAVDKMLKTISKNNGLN